LNSIRNTLELRKFNKKQVIEALRGHGELTKNEIARKLQLSVSTVGNIGRELVDEGIVREGPSRQLSGGRSPRVLALCPGSRTMVCADLTRTEEIVIQLSDLNDNELAHTTKALKEDAHLAELVEHVRSETGGLLARQGLPEGTCLGLGVIVPGWYDQFSGMVINSTNPVIEGSYLKRELEAALSLPVLVGNDANLGALALSSLNGDSRRRHIALLYVGTGLGVGVFGDGHIVCGSHGFAAEIAHLPLGDSDVDCYCGQRGCLEGILSLPGILRMYYGSDHPKGETGMQSLQRVIDSYRGGEPRAGEVIACFADCLGLAVAVVINLFDCETVYLGGIVDSFFTDIISTVRSKAFDRIGFPDMRALQIKGLDSTQRILFAGCAQMVFGNWAP